MAIERDKKGGNHGAMIIIDLPPFLFARRPEGGKVVGSLSNFSENELLDHIFNAAYSPAAHVYLCLCTADPTDAGTGASMNEYPDSEGYARTEITFGAAASRRITQNAEVAFPQASGNYSSAITHWAICDSGTHGAGNMLAHGAFSSSFQPVTGNTPKVASGQAYIEISATAAGAGFTTYCVLLMLDLMFRNQAWSTPAGNTFIAIYTAVLDDDDDTTDQAEENAAEYVRTEVNPNGGASPTWDLADGGVVDNTHEITLEAEVGVADDWDTDVALAVVSTASGAGKIYCYDSANVVDQRPRTGDSVKVAAGAFDITLS